MHNKAEYLIDLIFNKLKNNKSRKLNLEKQEFREFIHFLISNKKD